MSEFQEYVSYGAPGLIAFVIIKWILPSLKAITSKASAETAVYEMVKDQLKALQHRNSTLEKLYEAERKERRRLERLLGEQHKE